MAESMKDFERELEASFKKIEEGDMIRVDTRTGEYMERA